jgi:hypothetical protein
MPLFLRISFTTSSSDNNTRLPVAGGTEVGSKFRRGVGGPSVGGVDIIVSSDPRFWDPRTVVHLACLSLLRYAFRVAKLRGCPGDDGNPYRAVRRYGTYARRSRARVGASLMHDRAMREASELFNGGTREYTSTRSCAAMHDVAAHT